MDTQHQAFLAYIAYMEKVLPEYSNQLGSSRMRSSAHYLQHDEYEMSLEILVLEIMEHGIVHSSLASLVEIGRSIGMADASAVPTFVDDSWKRFEDYVTQVWKLANPDATGSKHLAEATFRSYVEKVLPEYIDQLGSLGAEEVLHLFNHGEYEISLECLVMGIVKREIIHAGLGHLVEIGRSMGMPGASQRDDDSWQRFEDYVARIRR